MTNIKLAHFGTTYGKDEIDEPGEGKGLVEQKFIHS